METKQIETRMDRVERNLDVFIQGILELKESQKKTDAQLQRTDAQIMELKESQKKTDEQLQKTGKRLDDVGRKLDDIGKQLGDMGLVQGEIAEDLFYRNVKYLFRDRNLAFNQVRRNLKKKGKAEYDIVAVNDKNVLVIEVKNKLSARMIDNFVNKKLPGFKDAFPEYQDYRLIGGIASLVMKDEVARYAEDAGLYVLTQSVDGGAAIFNKKDFNAKIFNAKGEEERP